MLTFSKLSQQKYDKNPKNRWQHRRFLRGKAAYVSEQKFVPCYVLYSFEHEQKNISSQLKSKIGKNVRVRESIEQGKGVENPSVEVGKVVCKGICFFILNVLPCV